MVRLWDTSHAFHRWPEAWGEPSGGMLATPGLQRGLNQSRHVTRRPAARNYSGEETRARAHRSAVRVENAKLP